MTTRGSSPMAPVRYVRDALVQLWADRRDIATILLYMENHGQKPRYLSDVLKFCIENIREQVKRQGIEYVESSASATSMLEERFNINLNPGGRGKKNYVNNLLLDSGYVPEVERPKRKVEISGSVMSNDQIEEIKRKAKAQFRSGEDDLLKTREEKDEELQQDTNNAFKNMFKGGFGDEGDED